jgi:methionyl-tRNA formyltransferase
LKLAILTTETPHHAYFVREIAKRHPIARVFCETQCIKPPFETVHPFEAVRERFECQNWFGGIGRKLGEIVETQVVSNMNGPRAVQALAQLRPDAIVVFGTGRLKAPVLAVQPERTFNLHGGDPREYRGLDTHLWAVYHGDFSGLVTTLHLVTPALDDGDIVANAAVPLHRGMGLYALRAANTEVCIALTLGALAQLAERGRVSARRQSRAGRYYSFMPAIMKDLVCAKFESHTGRQPLNAT